MIAKVDYFFYVKRNVYANKDGKQIVLENDFLHIGEDDEVYTNKCSHLSNNKMLQYENEGRTTIILVWKHKDKIIGNGKTYLAVSISKF